jgi:hypothetical protein
MPKARQLTDVEKFYIENNLEKSDSELASKMTGVGAKTVSKFRETIPDKPESDESSEERAERLATGPKTGDFIAKRSGASIMTQEASEVSDAKRKKSDTRDIHERKNRNIIYRPQG